MDGASSWSERGSALTASLASSPVALAVCTLALAVATRWAIECSRLARESRAVDERERHELYRAQRARALERAEEELRRAANERATGTAPTGDRDARDEALLAAKLAEIDAKAARLGLKAGRKLGGSVSSRPEWNPLAGGSEGRGYRPARRTPPGGGG